MDVIDVINSYYYLPENPINIDVINQGYYWHDYFSYMTSGQIETHHREGDLIISGYFQEHIFDLKIRKNLKLDFYHTINRYEEFAIFGCSKEEMINFISDYVKKLAVG